MILCDGADANITGEAIFSKGNEGTRTPLKIYAQKEASGIISFEGGITCSNYSQYGGTVTGTDIDADGDVLITRSTFNGGGGVEATDSVTISGGYVFGRGISAKNISLDHQCGNDYIYFKTYTTGDGGKITVSGDKSFNTTISRDVQANTINKKALRPSGAYKVTVNNVSGGTVYPLFYGAAYTGDFYAVKDERVSLDVKAELQYILKRLTVTENVNVDSDDKGNYAFTMPDSAVTVTPVFENSNVTTSVS